MLITAGEDGETLEFYLEGGQGFLIFPERDNQYMADNNDPWIYAWVEFDGMKAREVIAAAGFSFNRPIYISNDVNERERMRDELLYITNHANAQAYELMGHFYLFINALLASSDMRKKSAGGSLREFYVREAVSFIEQHYQEPITVESMATFCNLHRNYLGKIFKELMNETPQSFIIKYRVNKACELMKATNHSIGDISAMVGYPNIFTFSRTFHAYIGMSPRKWREENKLR
jgi:YesN/AraC family two-component response regulator